MTVAPFTKYEIGGAYHWKWYMVDYEGYRGFVDGLVARLPGRGRVLDIGCGDGLMTFALFRHGLSSVGIDTSELAIRLAGRTGMQAALGRYDGALAGMSSDADLLLRLKSGELEFCCQSAYDMDETDAYDFAFCIEVLEHLEQPRLALEKLHHAIREYAIITTPDGAFEELGPYDHQLWTRSSLAEFLTGYRFDFIDVRPNTLGVVLYKR